MQLWVREGLLGAGRPVQYCSTSEADAIQGRAAWYSTRSLQVDYCEAALTHEIPLLCQRPIGSPPQRAAYVRIIAVAAIPLPQSPHGPSIRAAQGRAPSGWTVPDLRARDPTLPPALALQREPRLLLHRCLHSAPSVRPCHGPSPAPPSPTTRGRPVLAAKPRRELHPGSGEGRGRGRGSLAHETPHEHTNTRTSGRGGFRFACRQSDVRHLFHRPSQGRDGHPS
jgi:hypothetical protein